MRQDLSISALDGTLEYPLKFGYSMVGTIEETGSELDPELVGQNVFSFQPHETRFVANFDEVVLLPLNVTPEQAVFLPNVETAVNFVQDGAPLVGESVAVFGLGVVGLLTSNLLGRFPLDLTTIDPLDSRRCRSLEAGAQRSVAPDRLEGSDFDLCYELSGVPEVLNSAIKATGYGGRVIVGSWYGNKKAEIDLGGSFHRSRISLKSSQVSTLAPELRGRWTKSRRMNLCLDLLAELRVTDLVTHRFSYSNAAEAYRLLDQSPQQALQVVLTYPE